MEILSDATFKGQIIAENYITSKMGLIIGDSSITEFVTDSGESFIMLGKSNNGLIGNSSSRNVCFYIGGVNSDGSACFGSSSIVASKKMQTCYATIGCLFLCSPSVSIGDGSGINLTHMSNEISNFSSTYLSKYDASSTYLTKSVGMQYCEIPINFDVPANCTRFLVGPISSMYGKFGSMSMFRRVRTSDGGYTPEHAADSLYKQVAVDLYQVGCASDVAHHILVEKSSSFAMGASDGYHLRLIRSDGYSCSLNL